MRVQVESRERVGLSRRLRAADIVRRQLARVGRSSGLVIVQINRARDGVACEMKMRVRNRLYVVRQTGQRWNTAVRAAAQRLGNLTSPQLNTS